MNNRCGLFLSARRTLLIVLALSSLIPLIVTSTAHSSTPQVYVYYNGTVVLYPNGVTEFRLLGTNITPITVYGSQLRLVNGTAYFAPNATELTYVANLSSGVVYLSEPYNFTLVLVLPFSYSLVYSNPPPSSVISSGKFYQVVIRGSTVRAAVVAISEVTTTKTSNNEGLNLVLLLASGLIASNSVLAWALFSLYKARKRGLKEVSQGEDKLEIEEGLNDRDKLVLNAVVNGARALSDIVRVTGLPKTTAYRRVKKLVKEGLLVERREGGKVWYEPNEEKLKGY